MKKIIGLIMIAGISYGASVVTPPGIQVNGLATNNNVMVYSDGMLLDSGVAPTNLVSVTNLTADIEELQANAIDSEVWAGVSNTAYSALYLDGTTNKTLIDAAINGLVIKLSSTGVKTTYLPAEDTDSARGTMLDEVVDTLTHGDTVVLYPGKYKVPNTLFFSNPSIEISSLSNLTFKGIGRPVIYGYDSATAAQYNIVDSENADYLTWDGIDVRLICTNSVSISNIYNYAFTVTGSQSPRIRNCTIQQELYGADHPGDKVFVAVNYATNVVLENVNIVALDTTGSNTIYHIADHDAADITFKNCNFIGNPTLDKFSVASNRNQLFFGRNCANVDFLSGHCSNPNAVELVGHAQAQGMLIQGTENLLTESMCDVSDEDSQAVSIPRYLDYLRGLWILPMDASQWKTSLQGGSGAMVTASQSQLFFSTGTTTNSYQAAIYADGTMSSPYSRNTSVEYVDFDKQIVMSGCFFFNKAGTGANANIIFGAGSSTSLESLIQPGFGIFVDEMDISIQVRNSSATTSSGTIETAELSRSVFWQIESMGDGTARYYIKVGTSTGYKIHRGVLTGAPTGQGAQYYKRISIRCDNGTSLNDIDFIVGDIKIQTFD